MGRKGERGGSAGGTRSGGKNDVSFNRVVPKFLQNIVGERREVTPSSTTISSEKQQKLDMENMNGHLDLMKRDGFHIYDDVQQQQQQQQQQQYSEDKNNEEDDDNEKKQELEIVKQAQRRRQLERQREQQQQQQQQSELGITKKRIEKKNGLGVGMGQSSVNLKKQKGKGFTKRNRNRLSFVKSGVDESDDESADDE